MKATKIGSSVIIRYSPADHMEPIGTPKPRPVGIRKMDQNQSILRLGIVTLREAFRSCFLSRSDSVVQSLKTTE